MAIVINDEQHGGGGEWFTAGLVGLVVVIVFVAVFFLFFVSPGVINSALPNSGLSSIDAITSLNFNPSDVVSSPLFTGQRQSVSAQPAVGAGNSQPFGTP